MTGMIALASGTHASAGLDPTVLLTWFTCLTVLLGFMAAIFRYGRKIMQMVEDFNGTAERPGVPARAGVMQRLQLLDDQVVVIHGEVNYNHGGSIKDAVDRVDARVEGMETTIGELKNQNDEKLRRLDNIDSEVKGLRDKMTVTVDVKAGT